MLSGPADRSNLRLKGLGVSLDPASTLLERALVLQLRPRGAQLNLIPNAKGQVWVFGPAGTKPPPRLSLKLLLEQPARFRLGTGDLDLKLQGRGEVRLHRRSADWRVTARPRAQGSAGASRARGRALLRGSANWGNGDVRLGLDLRRWDLAPLVSLIPRARPPRQQALKGTANGRLELSRSQGKASCRGSCAWPVSSCVIRFCRLHSRPDASRSAAEGSGSCWRVTPGGWRTGKELSRAPWFPVTVSI